ncbi:MAG: glutathione S-transferase N-terminal domain-containing protein [Pseudomonadota bacterium]
MIDLYTWTTPNGRKPSIMLEELGVHYTAHAVDIGAGDQFKPDFLAIAPNNRIPAIVDHDTGQTLMESGAILLYLAEKHAALLPEDDRWRTIEWLMWQMGGLGPMLGQTHHFLRHNKGTSAYAEERYHTEALRLYKVLNTRLDGRDFIAGAGRGSYSIADISAWPWISRFEWQQVDLAAFPNVRDWYLRIAERPGVQRGFQVPKDTGPIPTP